MVQHHVKTLGWTPWFYWILGVIFGRITGKIFFNINPVISSGVAIFILQTADLQRPKPDIGEVSVVADQLVV